jgi:hypothetical protein
LCSHCGGVFREPQLDKTGQTYGASCLLELKKVRNILLNKDRWCEKRFKNFKKLWGARNKLSNEMRLVGQIKFALRSCGWLWQNAKNLQQCWVHNLNKYIRCSAKIHSTDEVSHQKVCQYEIIKCPLYELSKCNCSATFPRKELLAHLNDNLATHQESKIIRNNLRIGEGAAVKLWRRDEEEKCHPDH